MTVPPTPLCPRRAGENVSHRTDDAGVIIDALDQILEVLQIIAESLERLERKAGTRPAADVHHPEPIKVDWR